MLSHAERAKTFTGHADRHYKALLHTYALWLHGRGMRWDRMRKGEDRARVREVLRKFAEFHLGGADGVRALWDAWRIECIRKQRDLFTTLTLASRWLHRRGYHSTGARMAWWSYLWVRKDVHLQQWSADLRKKFNNTRDALFRTTAIVLATEFETIAIDSYNIAALKMRPAPFTRPGEAPNETAQHNVQLVAPGRFREILLEVMGSRCTPRERPGDDDRPDAARNPAALEETASETTASSDAIPRSDTA
jgi:hypothetical protein